MRSKSFRWMLTTLLVIMLLGALPASVLAEGDAPEVVENTEESVEVQAMPIWGAPSIVRAWGGLRLREGPGLSERVILVLANGETVYPGAAPVWRDGYSWTFVKVYRYGHMYQGFAASMYLVPGGGSPPPPPVVHGLKVTAAAGLRLRYAPGLAYGIHTVVPYGTILQGTGATASANGLAWTEVMYGTRRLWAASMYLLAV